MLGTEGGARRGAIASISDQTSSAGDNQRGRNVDVHQRRAAGNEAVVPDLGRMSTLRCPPWDPWDRGRVGAESCSQHLAAPSAAPPSHSPRALQVLQEGTATRTNGLAHICPHLQSGWLQHPSPSRQRFRTRSKGKASSREGVNPQIPPLLPGNEFFLSFS